MVFIIKHNLYTANIGALHDVDISNLHASAFYHGICILIYANELVHGHCLNEEHLSVNIPLCSLVQVFVTYTKLMI